MIELTREDWAVLDHVPAWTHRWKEFSNKAYDMYKNQEIDYGNVCYRTVLVGMARLDPFIETQMNWFINQHLELFGFPYAASIRARVGHARGHH